MKSFRKRVWEITLFQKGYSQELIIKIILLGFSISIFLPLTSYASPTPTDSLRQQFYDSHCHLIQEQYQQASEGFQDLIGKYPVMEDYVRYYLAHSLMGEEKYRKAIGQWEDLIKNFTRSRLVDEAKISPGRCSAVVLFRPLF
jgi:outer membrane protein assembly factor BamD (BamD/ComL family)